MRVASTLDAFCIHPEVTIAEWLRETRKSFPPGTSMAGCVAHALGEIDRSMKQVGRGYDLRGTRDVLSLPAILSSFSEGHARMLLAGHFLALGHIEVRKPGCNELTPRELLRLVVYPQETALGAVYLGQLRAMTDGSFEKVTALAEALRVFDEVNACRVNRKKR